MYVAILDTCMLACRCLGPPRLLGSHPVPTQFCKLKDEMCLVGYTNSQSYYIYRSVEIAACARWLQGNMDGAIIPANKLTSKHSCPKK